MEICPNCSTEVADSVTRCPTCGLPRDLPVFASDGTVLGHTFERPQGASPFGPGSGASLPPATGGFPAGSAPVGPGNVGPGNPARTGTSRIGLVLAAVMLGALALGVAVAVIVNAVILNPARHQNAGPGTSESPSVTAPPSPLTSASGSPGAESPGAESPSGPASPSSATTSAPPPIDPEVLLQKVSGGIVSVVASTCSDADWSGRGTAFMIEDDLAVTSWTAVMNVVSVVVVSGSGAPIPATLERVDPSLGIALLRLETSLGGTPLTVGETPLAAGQTWYGIHADHGHRRASEVEELVISSIDGQGKIGDGQVSGAGVTDVPAGDEFLAGGPVVNRDGQVVGVAARYPDSDTILVLGIDKLRDTRSGTGVIGNETSCETPLGPPVPFQPLEGHHTTLEAYFEAINRGRYADARALLAPAIRGDEEETVAGWRSVYDFNAEITERGGGTVQVTFSSIFAKGQGPDEGGELTCANWSLIYSFTDGRIASAKATDPGTPWIPC